MSELLWLWLFNILNRPLLLLRLRPFRLTCFEKLFFLLSSQFFILSHFNTLFDGLRPLIVKISSQLFMELLQDV
jgi:hypothetical protein